MAVRQQQRRGTAAQWTSANPILSPGEIGFETDTNKFKIGNGTTRWVSLVYFTADAAAALEGLIDGAPGLLDTLNELAAAVGDDANFFSTVTSNIATAKSEAISTASADATTKVNAAKTVASTALQTHALSTNVHGIADTSVLATLTDVANAVSGAEVDQSSLAGTGLLWDGVNDQFTIDTTVATKTYADNAASAAVAAVIDTAPAALDTLNELAAAINDDASYAATITTALGNKQDKVTNVSDTEIGYLDGVTSAIQTQIDAKAPLASPGLTGTPTAPTASVGTDTTQVATTAFVKAAIQDISSLNLVLDGGGV
jgi:hypothetical protein